MVLQQTSNVSRPVEERREGPDRLINLQKTAEFDKLIEICTANIRARPDDERPLMIRASSYLKKGTGALSCAGCLALSGLAVSQDRV